MASFSRIPRFPHLVRPPNGLSGELWFLRQEVADALEHGGGGGWNFVLDSTGTGGPADPSINRFTTWAGLMAALDALPQGVQPTIQFLGDVTIPTTGMPPTGWNMRFGTWRSPVLATGSITVTLAPGVIIDTLSEIANGLAVVCNPTVDGETFQWSYAQSIASSIVWVLAVSSGACLRNNAAPALILGPGTGKYIVVAVESASFGALPPSVGPFVKADAPDVVIDAQSFSGFYGSLPDGWLVGSANRVDQVGVDTRDADVPGATGPIFLSARSVLNVLSLRGARRALTFTDGSPTPDLTDTFTDWAKLMAAYAASPGITDIVFRGVDGGPGLHIPSGTWQMKAGTRWITGIDLSAHTGGNSQVMLDTGAEVVDLCRVESVAIIGNGGKLTYTPVTPGGPPPVLILEGLGTLLANTGATPVLDWGGDLSISPFILGLSKTASIVKDGGGVPPVNITPLGAWTSGLVVYNIGGSLGDNTISGSDGPGTALLGTIASGDAHQSLKQPAWAAAAPLTTLYQSTDRPRFNIQTPPLTAVGPYVMGDVTAGIFLDTYGENGSEFVRYDASANDIGVQLPDPRFVPGQTVCLKEVGGAPAHNLVLTTPSGGVDGTPGGLTITPTAYQATRLTSDGVDWWIT